MIILKPKKNFRNIASNYSLDNNNNLCIKVLESKNKKKYKN